MRSQEREPHWVRAGGGEIHTDMDMWKKRTWTCRKSHFVWKFTGKTRGAPVPTSIKHGPSVPYRKNPFSVATLFGEKGRKEDVMTSKNLTTFTWQVGNKAGTEADKLGW